MIISAVVLLLTLPVLLWSADRFVSASGTIARHLGFSPLLIGMVVVGFGTSAPEMLVSALAAAENNPALALGNAYGSNITNIALILGLTAWIRPITVQSAVLRKELPVLVAVTALAAWQLRDGLVSRVDAGILLVVFGGLVAWTIRTGRHATDDTLGTDVDRELRDHVVSFRRALLWATVGLVVLVGAARAMVWSAVEVARGLGGSDLLIGLTIVAVGTSLPELASSIVAARKGEHDLALGNVLGSNLFNTLAVVGVAGSIRPAVAGPGILARDVLVMGVLTVGLFVVGYGFRQAGRINRVEGAVLVGVYVGYVGWLVAAAG